VQHDLVLRAASRPDGVVTIHLAGVVDAHTLDRFENGLEKALKAGAKSLVLDCEELRYVNSSGFGELIRYFDRLREKGGTLVLTRVPPKVAIILEMLGLKSLIPITKGLDEAMTVAAAGAVPAEPEPEPESLDPALAPAPDASPRERVLDGGSRVTVDAAPLAGVRVRAAKPVVTADKRVVVCAYCDTRLRIGGEGRWACPACGAPFSTTREGGVAFDWSRADAEAIHLTFDVSPRTLAALAGLLEHARRKGRCRIPHPPIAPATLGARTDGLD
jgi:anti-anti-sigma factor